VTTLTCDRGVSAALGKSDNQLQSMKPIGEQPPIPGGLYEMKLSWDRTAAYFRLEISDMGATWHFKKLQGHVQVLATANKEGRMILWGMARSDGETLTLYRDPDAAPHPIVEGRKLEPTNNRLCYFREKMEWRLRDERKTQEIYRQTQSIQQAMGHPDTLELVQGYVGDWACTKPSEDRGAHCFHGPDGWVIIDSDGLCHLYDPDLRYER
jgi:hypothetical protein